MGTLPGVTMLKYITMWDVKLCTMICVNVDIYVCNIIYVLSVKLTLSACV